MRKIFSLIAAVLFAGSMMATDPITINASDITGIESGATTGLDATVQGVQIVWEGAYYNSETQGCDIRVYANKTLTLTAPDNITKVEIAGYAKKDLAVSVDHGTVTTGASFASETTKKTLEDPLIVVEGVNSKSITFTCTKQMRAYIIRLTFGEAPAVAAPIIAGDVVFFDSTIVTMTCATTDADIYYTTDGTTDPKCDCSAAPEYKKAFVLKATTTVKAAAYTGNDWSAVSEKTFTKAPSFASFEALVAGGVADKALIEVSFENLVITRFYESSGDNPQRKGIYFNVGEVEYEIYNSSAVVPEAWEVDGKVSGTIRGQWQHYVNTSKGIDIWEVVPMANDWAWTELTYVAPAAAGCDWDNIEWLGGPAEYANQFKVCKPDNVGVVNIQNPHWSEATQDGIYMTFPSAAFGAISQPEGTYEKQGAGILFFVSAFAAKYTDVTVNCDGNDLIFTVYNDKGIATAIDNTVVSEKAIKMFENGQLIIIKNGVKYNALGSVIE